MENLKTEILKCYEELPKEIVNSNPGCVNLAKLGKNMSEHGIDYKRCGYGKLKDFISSLKIFDLHTDNSKQIPVVYVSKIINRKRIQTNKPKSTESPLGLFEWAYMGDYNSMIQDLAELALDEEWGFGTSNRYEILGNYLKYTFLKLYDENKILYAEDKSGYKYAAFNTGLVNDLYKPIFALFKQNLREDMQPWRRIDFCVAGEERTGKLIVSLFKDLPQPAQYFVNTADLLYDVSKGCPEIDVKHIVIERIDRLPYHLLKEYRPKNFEIIRTDSLSIAERNNYYAELRKAMEDDKYMYRRLKSRIEESINIAVERVRWNYKSAIPMYYERRKTMCLMLPLSFGRDNKADLALVVSKGLSGNYQAETIYHLDWAYRCARLVCRPDSDWLVARNINSQILDPE